MAKITVIIGADHRGFALKNSLVAWAHTQGWDVQDVGAHHLEPQDDYPDIALTVAERVTQADNTLGVILCGSGVGVAIAANKVPGIRAGHGTTPEQVEEARQHLDLNVLTLSGDHVTLEEAQALLTTFVGTPPSLDERHVRRRAKLAGLESHV